MSERNRKTHKCCKVMNKTGRRNLSTICTNGDFASALLVIMTMLQSAAYYQKESQYYIAFFFYTYKNTYIICIPFKYAYSIEKAPGAFLVLGTTIAMSAFILTISKLIHMGL